MRVEKEMNDDKPEKKKVEVLEPLLAVDIELPMFQEYLCFLPDGDVNARQCTEDAENADVYDTEMLNCVKTTFDDPSELDYSDNPIEQVMCKTKGE